MSILDEAGAGAIGALLIKIKPDGTDFQKDLEGITGKAGVNVGKAIGTASKVGLGAALAVGGGLLKLGTDLDSVYDGLRTQTGATGEALAGLETSFGNVAKNVPADLAVVGDALGTVQQKLDLTGKPLEDLTTQFVNLAHITGTDTVANIDAASAAFQQFNIDVDKQSGVLDHFFQVSQASGVGVADLFDQVNKSGALFSQFGLDINESADLLGLLEKNGLTARDATLGLTKVLQQAGKDGVAPDQALQHLVDTIKGAKSEAEGTAIAIDAFGAKAGPKLAGQIRDGTLSLDDLGKALGTGSDSINKVADDTADASETFKKLKNNLSVTLGPAANQLFSSFGKVATNMAPALLTVVKALTPLLEAVTALPAPILAVGLGGLAVGASFGKLVGPIKAVGSAIGGVTKLLSANPYIILAAATVALAVVIYKNWDSIREFIGEAMDAIGSAISTSIGAIQEAWDATWGAIAGTITTVFDGIETGVSGALSGITSAVEGTVSFITGIPGRIGDALTGIGLIITAPFRAAFNGIAIAWNNTVGKLSFHLPSWIPGIGGEGFDVPDIPQFAKGGILNRGVTGLVGERGPELFTAGDTGRVTSTDDLMRALGNVGTGGDSYTFHAPLVSLSGPVSVRNDQDIVDLTRGIARETEKALKAKGKRMAVAGA